MRTEFLDTLKDKNGKFSARKIASISVVLKNKIDTFINSEQFAKLPITEKIYWIINGFSDYKKCKKCGNDVVAFRSINDGYVSDFCSTSCRQTFHFDAIGRKVKSKLSDAELFVVKEQQKVNRKKTMLDRYGCESPFHKGAILNNRIKNKYVKYVQEKIEAYSDKFEALFSADDYEGSKSDYKWKCKSCQNEFLGSFANGQIIQCPTCYTPNASRPQHEIAEFIRSIWPQGVRINDRSILKKRELDILINGSNLAIEFNGIYWHSEKANMFDKDHLYSKMTLAQENGIKVINIFEDEWLLKTDIVKSIIKAKLGLSDRIFARKCKVEEVSKNTSDTFLNETHIQGADNASVRLGLYYQDELVSIMTFVKPRFDKKHEWEISRFSSKLNTTVIGGASKLFSYFVKTREPKSIITYADLRFGKGAVYLKLGFDLVNENTGLNYWYVKSTTEKLSRYQCQKMKLPKLMGDLFDASLTESENMKKMNFYRIWDCGNAKYLWTKE
jgi:hypothetical protein